MKEEGEEKAGNEKPGTGDQIGWPVILIAHKGVGTNGDENRRKRHKQT
jgi:hypothetical protein